MTRIVAGTHGGHTLAVPQKGTRPTSERVREALFSKLDHMGMCNATRVMDLFAGSGALGIEALSRGADMAVFVEKAQPAARIVAKNLDSLRLTEKSQVHSSDVLHFLNARSGNALSGDFDLILIDPPYDFPAPQVEAILAALGPWITPDALIVLEASARSAQPTLPGFLVCEEHKKYGETSVYFLGPPVPQDSHDDNDTMEGKTR